MTDASDRAQAPRSFSEVLAARRMCRDYLDRPVDPAVLGRVLRAAFRGPAAGNTSALDLVVLQGLDVARYWDVTLPAERRADFPWPGLLRAPVLVLPTVRAAAYLERYAEPDKARSGLGAGVERWSTPYWFVDGGAAVMALLLAAEADGLGALLFGQFSHEPAVRAEFGIPSDREVLGTVALGWPRPGGASVSASARRGRPPAESRLHHGGW